jgi:hypothetical protein
MFDQEMWERVESDEQRISDRLQVARREVRLCEARLRDIQVFRAMFEAYQEPQDDQQSWTDSTMSTGPLRATRPPADEDAWLRRLLDPLQGLDS